MVDEVQLGVLVPDPFGLRVSYDDKVIKNLAGSILQNGIATPLLVRPKNGVYEIIDGNYRYKALEHVGWEKPVPINSREMTDEEALLRAVIANWHRRNFTFMDKARAVKRLRKQGLSPEEITVKLELKHPKSVYHYLTFEENVPKEIKSILRIHPRVTLRHGRALAKLKDRSEQMRLAERIVTETLTGPQALREANKILNPEEYGPKLYECGSCGGKFKVEETKIVRLCVTCLRERIKHA